MKTQLTLLFALLSHFIFAQLTISGVVKNEEGKPVFAINVEYIYYKLFVFYYY
ncbi:hypothetical protein OBK21_02190 [Empedobacter falsenii]